MAKDRNHSGSCNHCNNFNPKYMRVALRFIGIIVASAFVGVITGIVFNALGASNFVTGQWVGVSSTVTVFILLRITE